MYSYITEEAIKCVKTVEVLSSCFKSYTKIRQKNIQGMTKKLYSGSYLEEYFQTIYHMCTASLNSTQTKM